MLKILDKRVVAALMVILVLAMGVSIFGIAKSDLQAKKTATGAKNTVIVDAGHGGFDGGASAEDVYEKSLNLLIATELEVELLGRGYNVIMTRTEDDAIGTGIKTTKTNDMRARRALADKNPGAIFVSIHMNNFLADRSCKGAQVFYGKKNEKSRELAEFLTSAIKADLQPENHRLPKLAGDGIYLMKTITNPAVIVECGFLSNAEELASLCNPDYQSKCAKAIASGIDLYYQK